MTENETHKNDGKKVPSKFEFEFEAQTKKMMGPKTKATAPPVN
jgi:hypothetical protein